MADISAQMVNDLRKQTGAGLMDCKKALVESNGDTEEAITLLKKKGIASAAKKADREAAEGTVGYYIHSGGRIGVLVEVNCETDFVAKNEDFQALVRNISMHVAAASPLYVSREDVPAELLEKEMDIARAQTEGKPAQAAESIIKGKIDKWYATICLLEQEYVKEAGKTIQDIITEAISKMGENIVVRRFARFQIGA